MRAVFRNAVFALLLSAGAALAVQPEEQLADPALEARAREISKNLRCVVCQNQSIDDSNAQIAADMRKLVRDRLVAGDSDAEVRDLLVQYYGEYVLLRPRFSLSNLFIWLAGPVALAIGVILARNRLRRQPRAEPAAERPADSRPLSDEEQRRLKDLLGE